MTNEEKSIADILKQIMREELALHQKKSGWVNATFEDIRRLQIDSRGEIGEKFIAKMLLELGYKVEFSNVTNPRNKQWDLEVDGKTKLEVKTASRGASGNTFQHESLDKNRLYDAIVLLDIAPEAVYISLYTQVNFPWARSHRRKDSIYYKYDTKVKQLEESGKRIDTLADFKAAFEHLLSELNH